MQHVIRGRLTYANVMATLAVFLSVAGTSYAAVNLANNSILSRHIKDGQVTTRDLANNSVTTAKVKNGSLRAVDFATGQIPGSSSFDPTGPAGPAGPAGPTGPMGPAGPAGMDAVAPANAVMFFNRTTCPTGWSEFAGARGRYVVGLPSGGDLGLTRGDDLYNGENRAVGRHRHDIDGHKHTIPATGTFKAAADPSATGTVVLTPGTGTMNTGTTWLMTDHAGSTFGTNAPYIQLLACSKN